MAQRRTVDGSPYTITKSLNWKTTVQNLPATDIQGRTYTYTVEEVNVAGGFTPSVSGFVITNTYTPPVGDVPVQVTWVDGHANHRKPTEVELLNAGRSAGKKEYNKRCWKC